MTHFFQPLDLSAAKIYPTSVQQQLQSGKAAEEVDVGECHKTTSCTVACTLQILRDIILNRWKKAGISGLLDGITPEDTDYVSQHNFVMFVVMYSVLQYRKTAKMYLHVAEIGLSVCV